LMFIQVLVVVKDSTYQIVERMPEFPGKQEGLNNFLSQNLHYPQKEWDAGISGKVYISFTVDQEGYVNNIRELRGIPGGPGLTQEAIRVVKLMPKWKPGMQAGKLVSVQYTLPFNFKIPPQSLNGQKARSDSTAAKINGQKQNTQKADGDSIVKKLP